MELDATVCIGTYGDERWRDLAYSRAVPSVPEGVPVHCCHRATLHDARNAALHRVETEWVIHLDADDELTPGYLEAMAQGEADVRAPMVRFVYVAGRTRMWRPTVYGHDHWCSATCLEQGNWIVIGAAVRTQLLWEAGGWRDFPWSEDWDLWLRCRALGASFEWVPEAIYQAHVRADSRNRAPEQAAKLAAHKAIAKANGL